MKRLFTLLTLVGFLTFTFSFTAVAQDDTASDVEQTDTDTTAVEAEEEAPVESIQVVEEPEVDPFAAASDDERSFHQKVKEKFKILSSKQLAQHQLLP